MLVSNMVTHEYFPILVFLGIAFGLALVISGIPFLLAKRKPYPIKLAPYECGFDAFEDARVRFDVRFYLVAILFIVFDLEIAFLFPWAMVLKNLPSLGFWSMIVFIAVLAIGFLYEWKKGALDWS